MQIEKLYPFSDRDITILQNVLPSSYDIAYGSTYSIDNIRKAVMSGRPAFCRLGNRTVLCVGEGPDCLVFNVQGKDVTIPDQRLRKAWTGEAVIIQKDLNYKDVKSEDTDFVIFSGDDTWPLEWEDIKQRTIKTIQSIKLPQKWLPPHPVILTFKKPTEEIIKEQIKSCVLGADITIYDPSETVNEFCHEVGHIFWNTVLTNEERESFCSYHKTLNKNNLPVIYTTDWSWKDPEEMFATIYLWYMKAQILHAGYKQILAFQEREGFKLITSVMSRIDFNEQAKSDWRDAEIRLKDWMDRDTRNYRMKGSGQVIMKAQLNIPAPKPVFFDRTVQHKTIHKDQKNEWIRPLEGPLTDKTLILDNKGVLDIELMKARKGRLHLIRKQKIDSNGNTRTLWVNPDKKQSIRDHLSESNFDLLKAIPPGIRNMAGPMSMQYTMLKAGMADRTHLIRKQVRRKDGHMTTVWVKAPGDIYERTKKYYEKFTKFLKKCINENDNKYKDFSVGKVTKKLKNDLLNFGINIDDNYQHKLSNYAINHIINRHGDNEKENLQGQEGISLKELKQIPEILRSYDKIEKIESKRGLDRIKYTKHLNGSLIIIEEVRKNPGNLFVVSFRKKKGYVDVLPPHHSTSETVPSAQDQNKLFELGSDKNNKKIKDSQGVYEDVIEKIKDFFKTTSFAEARGAINSDYKRNDISSKFKISESDYFNHYFEYFRNKEKWDKKFNSPKQESATEKLKKQLNPKPAGTPKKKTSETKWNLNVMRYIYQQVNQAENNFGTMPEVENDKPIKPIKKIPIKKDLQEIINLARERYQKNFGNNPEILIQGPASAATYIDNAFDLVKAKIMTRPELTRAIKNDFNGKDLTIDKLNEWAAAKVFNYTLSKDLLAEIKASGINLNLEKEWTENNGVSLIGKKVNNSSTMAHLAQVYRNPQFETMRIIMCGDDKKVKHEIGVTCRLPGSALAFPVDKNNINITREEVFANLQETMKRSGATHYYLLHNHPSGRVQPSQEDIMATKGYIDLLPGFKSHIVINHDKYSVINKDGVVEKDLPEIKRKGKDYTTASINHPIIGTEIKGAGNLIQASKNIEDIKQDQYFSLICTDARLCTRGVVNMPKAWLKSQAGLKKIREYAIKLGSKFTFPVGINFNDPDYEEAIIEGIKQGYFPDVSDDSGKTFSNENSALHARLMYEAKKTQKELGVDAFEVAEIKEKSI